VSLPWIRKLRLIIGKGLFLPLDFALLVFGFAIEPTEDMLDTRNCPQGILRLRLALYVSLPRMNRSGSPTLYWLPRLNTSNPL
jgi:hypothetical protein